MNQYDPRVDDYIDRAAEFARPILLHIRSLVHESSPLINETMKWSFPHFDYKGTVCSMASFKEHCTFGFWKSSLMADPYQLLKDNAQTAMGQFGRIITVNDLPKDEIIKEYVTEAVRLNESGIKTIKPKTVLKKELIIPDYFIDMLHEYPLAKGFFEKMSYSHKKEYVEWITEAKTELTRINRLNTTIEMLTEGKSRYAKYK